MTSYNFKSITEKALLYVQFPTTFPSATITLNCRNLFFFICAHMAARGPNHWPLIPVTGNITSGLHHLYKLGHWGDWYVWNMVLMWNIFPALIFHCIFINHPKILLQNALPVFINTYYMICNVFLCLI